MPRGIHMKGRIIPTEIRRKISIAMKGKKGHPCSDETKVKLREINLGKKASEEARKNMSLAHGGDGNPLTQYQRTIRVRENKAGRPRPNNCEVCGAEGLICFDHDHTTGKFRGWLCGRCNKVLGFAADNSELLIALSNYLKDSRENGTK